MATKTKSTSDGKTTLDVINKDFDGDSAEFAKQVIIAWQSSNFLHEVVQRFGIKRPSLLSFTSGLRRNGVPLKKYSYSRKYDYPSLIKLAEEYKSYGRVETKRSRTNGDN